MRRSISILTLTCLVTAGAFASSDREHAALARYRQLQMEYREGNVQVLGPLVSGLESAVARSPHNADLWEALGNAYMSKLGVSYDSPAGPGAMIPLAERARSAYARALSIEKDNALLLVSLGMADMAISSLKQDGPGMMKSVEGMNAAILMAPNSTAVRLTRGFTIVNLPVGMRDTAAVKEDLTFLLGVAPSGRPEDVIHVLLGDVYAETGALDDARREYEQVTGASRFASEQVRSRLDELKKGAVSPASIGAVRAGLGRCVMCHAPGTDN